MRLGISFSPLAIAVDGMAIIYSERKFMFNCMCASRSRFNHSAQSGGNAFANGTNCIGILKQLYIYTLPITNFKRATTVRSSTATQNTNL